MPAQDDPHRKASHHQRQREQAKQGNGVVTPLSRGTGAGDLVRCNGGPLGSPGSDGNRCSRRSGGRLGTLQTVAHSLTPLWMRGAPERQSSKASLMQGREECPRTDCGAGAIHWPCSIAATLQGAGSEGKRMNIRPRSVGCTRLNRRHFGVCRRGQAFLRLVLRTICCKVTDSRDFIRAVSASDNARRSSAEVLRTSAVFAPAS